MSVECECVHTLRPILRVLPVVLLRDSGSSRLAWLSDIDALIEDMVVWCYADEQIHKRWLQT